MKIFHNCMLSVVLLVVTPYHCMADPYIGFGIGQSSSQKLQEHDITGELNYGFNGGEDLEMFKQETTDISFKIFAGYEFKDWIGFEFGYIDFGENSFVAEDTTNPSTNVVSYRNHIEAKADLTGIYIAAMPRVIYSNGVSANLKIGVMSWDASGVLKRNVSETYTDRPAFSISSTDSLSGNGTDLMIGLGISYGIYFLEYERVKINSDDVDLIMLSLRLKSPLKMM